jgi:hypothetical protein
MTKAKLKKMSFEEAVTEMDRTYDNIHDRESLIGMAKDALDDGSFGVVENIAKALRESNADWFNYDWTAGECDTPTPIETKDDLEEMI